MYDLYYYVADSIWRNDVEHFNRGWLKCSLPKYYWLSVPA